MHLFAGFVSVQLLGRHVGMTSEHPGVGVYTSSPPFPIPSMCHTIKGLKNRSSFLKPTEALENVLRSVLKSRRGSWCGGNPSQIYSANDYILKQHIQSYTYIYKHIQH